MKKLIERDPIDYLKALLAALLVLGISLVLIAIAEFLLPPGLLAEGIALVALLAAAPALLIGCGAFLLMIFARLRTLFRSDDER